MDQFIIAYLPKPSQPEPVVSHAVALAKMLHKGLILLSIHDTHYAESPDQSTATMQLQSLTDQIKQPSNPLYYADTSYCSMHGDTHDVLTQIPKLLAAVAIVVQVDCDAPHKTPTHPRHLLHLLRDIQIAYLTVQQPHPNTTAFYIPALTIDYRRESKEKLIWASYFARFGGSDIKILRQDYKDEGLRDACYENMRFVEKIFGDLNIHYHTQTYSGGKLFTEPAAVSYAAQHNISLFISLTTDTRDRDMLEWIIGTPEQRVIRNPEKLPILFLNQRDDLYVLCD
ncbi:MAG: hypothetical protein KBT04_04955 [Bacteroidales bacterium]|nr:hypothetical protein [Candidatus Colimorpha onthohippi]